MKRIVLFLLTNIAIMIVISIIINLLGVNRYLTQNGIDYGTLLAFSAVVGFSGSFISLLLSKTIAKWSVGAKVITTPKNEEEMWLQNTVSTLASRAGLNMPEVAIYKGSPNAFATGATKSNSLVAVSDELLASMDRKQVEAVLAHEISHVANGDMVTLTLIQGVVNTFVIFLAKIAAFFVDSVMNKRDNDRSGASVSIVYYLCDFVFQILFGILASIIVCMFSRKREYRADKGATTLMGTNQYMIEALRTLGNLKTTPLPKSMAASGIAGGKVMALFSTHPSIADRISALEKN